MAIEYTDRTESSTYVHGVNAKWIDGKTLDEMIELFISDINKNPSKLDIHNHPNLQVLDKLSDVSGELMYNNSTIKDKKTLMFYVGLIENEHQSMTLYVPHRAKVSEVNVNLGKTSVTNLKVILATELSDFFQTTVIAGNNFSTNPSGFILDNQRIILKLEGETGLSDINVSLVLETF